MSCGPLSSGYSRTIQLAGRYHTRMRNEGICNPKGPYKVSHFTYQWNEGMICFHELYKNHIQNHQQPPLPPKKVMGTFVVFRIPPQFIYSPKPHGGFVLSHDCNCCTPKAPSKPVKLGQVANNPGICLNNLSIQFQSNFCTSWTARKTTSLPGEIMVQPAWKQNVSTFLFLFQSTWPKPKNYKAVSVWTHHFMMFF